MGVFEHFPYTNFHDLNLDWILKNLNEIITVVKELEKTVGGWEDEITSLEKWREQVEAGELTPGMTAAITKWCKDNFPKLMEAAVKNVFFGLTDTGYFVAYIPQSWQDITFNTTGLDITVDLCPEYGHLILSY